MDIFFLCKQYYKFLLQCLKISCGFYLWTFFYIFINVSSYIIINITYLLFLVTPTPGQTAVVYHPDRYYRPDGTDVAMGMLGGAAVGSLMWGPLLWW